jgi:hypothetical protein
MHGGHKSSVRHVALNQVITLDGQDYNIETRSKGWEANTWGWWWKPPSSPVRYQIPATMRRKINCNENKKWGHQNEAQVMYITTVTIDHPHSSYLERNVRWKIMVCQLEWHSLNNWDHHWPASSERTLENHTNKRKSHWIARSRSKTFEVLPLKWSF